MGKLCAKLKRRLTLWGYRRDCEHAPIDSRCVLFDQQHGLTADGSLFYLAHELATAPEFAEYGLSLHFAAASGKGAEIAAELALRGLSIDVVERGTRRYYRLLARAGFLVCDTSFPHAMSKRLGQVLFNTWHGTPLKTLGRDERSEAHLIGNVQRNLAQADLLLFPNAFTRNRMSQAYMLPDLFGGRVLECGYPRNVPFAAAAVAGEANASDPAANEPIKSEPTDKAAIASFGDDFANVKRAYTFLPTFRFNPETKSKDGAVDRIAALLAEADELLTDDEVLFAHLHPAAGAYIDLSAFKHVRGVPDGVELYAFLARCDALATDYSSVMFDFALTRRKVVLFPFDRTEYLAERGLYLDIDDLPFPQVRDVRELVSELRSERAYDDSAFLQTFAPYDAPDATTRLCRRVFGGQLNVVSETGLPRPQRPTALVVTGTLSDEPDSCAAMRCAADLADTHSVYLAFPETAARGKAEWLSSLPADLAFIPLVKGENLLPLERLARRLCNRGIIGIAHYDAAMRSWCAFELRRLVGEASFDTLIVTEDAPWKLAHLFSKLGAHHKALAQGAGPTPKGWDAYAAAAFDELANPEAQAAQPGT